MKKPLLLFLLCSACTTVVTNVNNTTNLSEFNVKQLSNYKVGETCAISVLSVGPFGNSSIIETAKTADIGKIIFVDTKTINNFVYKKHCLVVYGI
ncbi:hypothetical protein LPTSP4_02100 [Leptospira ryugenii]|uniref:TRL-like family protein n=1 Tax=Leptospira ryugenii TaxID=1917863 RepID=A0A2P2DVX2_9LEPT|nr:TRL domain-containing protein [Leptospira ryugenii]GBF48710.1 hypothetical protein LPTSP4_02100 [Leptospira ryugenii]